MTVCTPAPPPVHRECTAQAKAGGGNAPAPAFAAVGAVTKTAAVAFAISGLPGAAGARAVDAANRSAYISWQKIPT